MTSFAWTVGLGLLRSPHLPAGPDPKAAAKTAAKVKGKKKSQQNPVATWDVRKAKLSTLDKVPFPLVDRKETKSLLQSVILGKALPTFVSFVVAIKDIRAPAHSSCEAGTFAKICLQLKGHEESQTALENLEKEKNILEDAWQVSRPRVASMVLS